MMQFLRRMKIKDYSDKSCVRPCVRQKDPSVERSLQRDRHKFLGLDRVFLTCGIVRDQFDCHERQAAGHLLEKVS